MPGPRRGVKTLPAKIERQKHGLTERRHQVIRATQLLLPALTLILAMPDSPRGQASAVFPARLLLEHSTPVNLQFVQTISSAHVREGDLLDFVVVKDVAVGDFLLISAGTIATGSVTEVKEKRPLGRAGRVVVKLDSVALTNGKSVELVARKEFKGNSLTIRMGVAMAIAAVIYLPAAPVFLISRGRDRTVLKGTEVTAFT